jgi:electron transfer flavoprotein beta subunit
MQLVGEQLGILDQFQGVDQITIQPDGSFEILERIEGGRHMASICQGPPALLGWATGNLPEPRNNPQIGMANMRTVMPALQKAKTASLPQDAVRYLSVTPPKQQRQTRIVKDRSADEIAAELLEWIAQD